jgi:hypothetical protein
VSVDKKYYNNLDFISLSASGTIQNMASEKRPAQDDPGAMQMVKRPNLGTSTGILARTFGAEGAGSLAQHDVPRVGGLQAPIMELTGHAGEVFVARFDPTGAFVASGSMDRRICKSARRQRIVETDSMMLIFG